MRVCIRAHDHAAQAEDEDSFGQDVVIIGNTIAVKQKKARKRSSITPSSVSEALRRMTSGVASGPMLSDTETLGPSTVAPGSPACYKSYNFENIFCGSDADDWDSIFIQSGAIEIVNSVINGNNGDIMTYGHSQTGKSYTIDNMTLAALKHIFDHKHHTAGGKEKKVLISVFELFKETLHDLISESSDIKLECDSINPGSKIMGLEEQVASDLNESIDIIESAKKHRNIAVDEQKQCTRSHVFVRIIVSHKNPAQHIDENLFQDTGKGALTLIDLAGREAIELTSLESDQSTRSRDIASLNRDLLMLGSVINGSVAYAHDKPVYVPFRNTKLTSILAQALSGDEECLIIGCIVVGFGGQNNNTIHTLDFCSKAKQLSDMDSCPRTVVAHAAGRTPILEDNLFHEDATRMNTNRTVGNETKSHMSWTKQSGFSALTDVNTLHVYPTIRDCTESQRLHRPNTPRQETIKRCQSSFSANPMELMERLEQLEMRLEFLQPMNPTASDTVVNEHVSKPSEVDLYLENIQEVQCIREELVCSQLEINAKAQELKISLTDEVVMSLKRWVIALSDQTEDYIHSMMDRIKDIVRFTHTFQQEDGKNLFDQVEEPSRQPATAAGAAVQSMKGRVAFSSEFHSRPQGPDCDDHGSGLPTNQVLRASRKALSNVYSSMAKFEEDLDELHHSRNQLDASIHSLQVQSSGTNKPSQSSISRIAMHQQKFREIELRVQIRALSVKQDMFPLGVLLKEISCLCQGDAEVSLQNDASDWLKAVTRVSSRSKLEARESTQLAHDQHDKLLVYQQVKSGLEDLLPFSGASPDSLSIMRFIDSISSGSIPMLCTQVMSTLKSLGMSWMDKLGSTGDSSMLPNPLYSSVDVNEKQITGASLQNPQWDGTIQTRVWGSGNWSGKQVEQLVKKAQNVDPATVRWLASCLMILQQSALREGIDLPHSLTKVVGKQSTGSSADFTIQSHDNRHYDAREQGSLYK